MLSSIGFLGGFSVPTGRLKESAKTLFPLPSTVSESFHKWANSWICAAPSREDFLIKIRSLSDLLAIFVAGFTFLGALYVILSLTIAPLFPVSGILIAMGITCMLFGLICSFIQVLSSVFWDARLNRSAAKSQGKEIVIYVLPKDDGSPTMHMSSHKAVLQVAKGKKLIVARISTESQLTDLINRHRNISHLWINAHGCREGVWLGRDLYIKADISKKWPRFHFTANAQIVLDSCSTAAVQPKHKTKSLSFAEALFYNLGKQVTVLGASRSIIGAEVDKKGKIALRRLCFDYTVRFNGKSMYLFTRCFLMPIDFLRRLCVFY
ncbi:MAG: hypothetical protein RLZZ453_409 [Chlamydiota bacterium]|jgi:hypothetical protein